MTDLRALLGDRYGYDGHTPQEAAERLRQAARDGQYVTADHADTLEP